MTIKELFSAFAEEYNIPWAQLNLEPEAPDQICIMIDGKNGRYEGHALCLEEEGLFVFYTLLGVRVPEEKREKLSLLLMGLNYRLKTGSFFIEEETGELTVRTTQYLMGADWEKRDFLGKLVADCGKTADYYYPQIMKWMFG